MKATPESLRLTADALEIEDTRNWQLRNIGSEHWLDAKSGDKISCLDEWEYRPKPAQKLRPWTINEVPVGSVVVSCCGNRRMITASLATGIYLGGKCEASSEDMLAHYTLANGQPCGVME